MKPKYIKFLMMFLSTMFMLAACAPGAQVPTPTIITAKTPPPSPVPTPTKTPKEVLIHQTDIEIVSDNTATGDGGNIWGGHQTRIVHTLDGVFTAYTVEGDGYFSREWRLSQRQSDNSWKVIAQGVSGREPVNLLASPDGTLHVIGWPKGIGTIWSGKPQNGSISMSDEIIPNMPQGDWPYSSAGIDASGNLCVLASNGGEQAGGEFYWSCYLTATQHWVSHTSSLDYRYCYTYVFPSPGGELSLVSTRDVRWSALGYQQPAGAFDYAFNAFGYWRTNNILADSIEQINYAEETPTELFPNAFLNAQMDAYLDTQGHMHILYWQMGETTNGASKSMHRIVSDTGEVLFDEEIPEEAGYFSRIFQDKQEQFYLLGSSGVLYPMDQNGEKVKAPIQLNLEGHEVEYSGFGLSVPRTGTPLSNTIDVVFPSGNETQWLYFQLNFSGN